MPVIIENISPRDRPNSQPHDYRLRINAKLITNFRHVRDRGLAECLRAAADAVDALLSEPQASEGRPDA